jgi:hypothetical protein
MLTAKAIMKVQKMRDQMPVVRHIPRKKSSLKPSGRRYRSVQALISEQAIPDSFSYHEMMDRVSIYNGLVDDLVTHPVAVKHTSIRLLAIEATQVLTALYEEAVKLHPGQPQP